MGTRGKPSSTAAGSSGGEVIELSGKSKNCVYDQSTGLCKGE